MTDRKKRKKDDYESQFDYAEAEKFFKPEWFHIPARLSLRELRTETRNQNRSPTKIREYLNSKKDAEFVRRKLLKLVKSEKTDTDDQDLPNSEERTFIKYNYYIHQGIDIANIAPLENSWITNIMERVPPKLRSKARSMGTLLSEVQDDFMLSVKRGKIHDVLQDYNEHYDECYRQIMNEKRLESLDEIKTKRHHFETIKYKIQKNLFKIHPTIVKISYMWFSQYRNMRIINIKELYSSDALELNQFSDWLILQIELCRSIILEKWIPSVFKIVTNVMEKKSFTVIREKKLKRFYECISTLMSLQLQTLRDKTIAEYTNFICDVKHSPGFQVHVLYKNNKIIFNPSYKDFQRVFLSAFEKIIAAVSTIFRIETKLYVPDLIDSDKLYLKPSIIPEIIERNRSEVEQTLEDEWICPELKIQDFDDYVCLINGQSRIEVNKFLSEERDFHLFEEKVLHYHDLGFEISLSCSKVETIASFEIHREHFISILINKSQATKDRFLNKITDTYQEMCKRLNEEFQEIKDNLLKPPANTAELVRMKEYNLKLGTETLFEMEDRLRETMNYILFVSDYVPLSSGQIKQNSITFLWYRRINGILEENRSIIKERTEIFQDFLLSRIETFNKNLEAYRKEVDEFQNYRDASELSKYLKKAQNLHKKFKAATESIREFNEEEEAFGWMKTSYPKRDELVEKLLPYKKLYENCADYKNKYKIWVEAKVGSYGPEEIEENVKTFHDNIIELSKEFSSNPAPYALTNSIKLEVEQFQKHMPIVKTLGNPCLKDRHWEKISEIVGFPLRVEEDLSLAKILDYGFEEYVDKFQTISDSATKENGLEMKLNHMIAEWQNVKFAIAPYRDSGTFVLTTTDEIQVLLDDHIVKTQMMKNSPYIKPFESAIHSWEEKLILLQEIIDTWLVVQKTWIYLEPIFSISDIQHLIPEESKRFNALDKIWKDIMKSTSLITAVLQVINIEKVLERLVKCNTLLNMIQNGLTGFLETKRSFFPRFYFLSNKEILDIISNTRDPSGVQPYLKKCFSGVKSLRLNETGDIRSLISDLGEELDLVEIIDTGSKRGQVEKWLADLERVMKNSVKQEVKDALVDYEKRAYIEWIDSWTQQVLLLITGIVVTRELRERLVNAAAIKSFLQDCNEKLESMIALLAERVDLRKRYVLVSLIIFFLQTRDQLASISAKSELEKRNELCTHVQYEMRGEDIVIRNFACCIEYGYEYMGNFIPLIMTPTTDSCYKFIFTSHKYHYEIIDVNRDHAGICLEGPPGTGKTEIVKDFSRRIARHYVIFGCSKTLNYSVIETLFKGIASSDIFVCFDNLDVVEAENLRIIEHHVTRIQQAIQFGDHCIKLNGLNEQELSCNQVTFATINTKLSHRTKLPPLLKTYLRPYNFHRNELKTITTIKLLLLGFKNCEFLAAKLEAIFRVGAELFRSKNFFTNDLRTLETIMKNITGIKQCRSLDDEEKILSNAVETVYRPLFFAEDWLLFKKILALAFKNVNTLPLDESLTNAVRDSCKRENVVFDGNIFDKVQQLLNAMNHFTGVILVGDTFGGKSTILKLLSTTLQKSPFDEEVETVVINPKSVTVKQLFGHQDERNEKWIDGILSTYYRQFQESNSKARKWLIFDGPVNTSWVENLNSVLDNSKKLCLESGESIPLGKRTHLVFETDNLSNISPVTISRCAVIAVKSSFIKWEYLLTSWLNTLPPAISEPHKNHIQGMASRFCRVLFYFMENCCKEPVYPVTKNHMIRSLCNFFDCFMDDYKNEGYIRSLSEIDVRSQLEGVFSFSCIWSLGGLLDEVDKENFDVLFRALQGKELSIDIQKRYQLPDDLCRPPNKRYVYVIPDFGTVFDYQYIKEGKGKWKLWFDGVILNSPISRELHFRQIVVPTKTTVRNQHLISLLANKQKTVMLVGDTASGKTTDITYFLNTKLDLSEYKPVYLNLNAGSTGNSVQNLINCKLEKRKKGVYGPPLGIRYVLFIDDMNASTVDKYGTNSAIELLKHWLEFGSWYNLDDASVVRLIDMQLLCAMTTNRSRIPKTSLCPRFTKFCTIINNEIFNEEVLRSIFSKIMLWHLDTRGFSKEFDPCIEQIVNATLAIHRRVQNHLMPVPEKSHYIFNLRDFARIIQGVVLSVPEAVEDLPAMKRLWVHEVTRIYHDRILDSVDSDWYIDNLREVMQVELAEDLNTLLQHLTEDVDSEVRQRHLRKLMFCDFINPKADIRNYAEVQDMESLQSIVEGYLTEYNNVNRNTMNLLLFSYSIEHLSRICRIIKQPQGHALLLGEYGCGKQSLARLAIHMCEYEFFEIEFSNCYNQNDWREDMKNLLFSVYTDQHSAFLCTNIQTLTVSMLEDINNLLQYAEIPEIFTQDDKTEIYEKMEVIDNQRDKALQTDGSHEALFNLFLQRIKKQIHIVLVVNMSVYDFREFFYRFPAFMNCCTIDWFEPWSEETQTLMAQKLLHNVECEYNSLQLVVRLCNEIHNIAKRLSKEINTHFGINVHFTQKTFTSLVTIFRDLLTRKQKELRILRNLYEEALSRLAAIKEQIPILEHDYKTLLPLIREKKSQVEKLESSTEIDREAETEAEIALNGSKTKLKNCEKKVNLRKSEYEKKLKEVMDVHENVTESLQLLSTNDIAVLKSMKSPPKPVKLVAEAIVYIKELKAEKMQESGKIVDDFWKPAVKLIGDSKFIDTLVSFNPTDMSARVFRLLEERIIAQEDFDSDKIKSYSSAAEIIFRWISVLYEFNKVTKMDSDVKVNLSMAEEEYENAKLNVAEREKHLEEAKIKRENVLGHLDQVKKELDQFGTEANSYNKKNMRARELVQILDSKKDSWIDEKRKVEEKIKTLIGDVLLCSAVLSYLTAVPQRFRQEKIFEWYSLITSSNLCCGPEFKFPECLLDEMELQEIKFATVVEDEYFNQILAIVRHSPRRYPLLIDPYGLMTSWIKNVEHGSNIVTINVDYEDYLRNLENAITSGSPVLLEHVHEKLDPILYPVFEKETFKTSAGIHMKIGKSLIEYNENFRMYLSCEIRNSRFNPEIYEKLTVVNCLLEKSSVKNHLLKAIIKKDKPDLETFRQQSAVEFLKLKKISAESELKILNTLVGERDILEAEVGVNNITTDVMLIEESSKKIADLNAQLELFHDAISEYGDSATYFADLFEILENLRNLNVAYQFSLKWFKNLLVGTIERMEKVENTGKRLNTLCETFLHNLYSAVTHSLVETDKLVFAYLLALYISERRKWCSTEELHFCIECLRKYVQCPNTEIDSNRVVFLENISILNEFENFKSVLQFMRKSEDICGHTPEYDFSQLDSKRQEKLNPFQNMLMKNCLFPDTIMDNIRNFTEETNKSLKWNDINLKLVYKESKCCLPITLIVFGTSDPTSELFNLAASMGISLEKCKLLTTCELDNPTISECLDAVKASGSWLIVRNLQHTEEGVSKVEKIFELLTPSTVHPDFRLWIILQSNLHCSEFILRNSFTVAYEKSDITDLDTVKQNLSRRLSSKEDKNTPTTELHCFSNLTIFHLILTDFINELPFNRAAVFNEVDFHLAFNEIHSLMILEPEKMKLERVYAILRHCTYGPQITNKWDVRYLINLKRSIWNDETLLQFQNYTSGAVHMPAINDIAGWLSTFLPSLSKLYDEMAKLKKLNRTHLLLHQILKIKGCLNVFKRISDNVILTIEEMVNSLPKVIRLKSLQRGASTRNVFTAVALVNETEHFNTLISSVKSNLLALKNSLEGHSPLTNELETFLIDLNKGRIRVEGSDNHAIIIDANSFRNYVAAKFNFLSEWTETGVRDYDLAVLKFPKNFFILNSLQRCLDQDLPINKFHFDNYTIHNARDAEEKSLPSHELRVCNLLLSNAYWNPDSNRMTESNLMSLHEIPCISLIPHENKDDAVLESSGYFCPVYQIGDETENERCQRDFVISVVMPNEKCSDKWIKRRVNLIIKK